jgi:hypothetical protein
LLWVFVIKLFLSINLTVNNPCYSKAIHLDKKRIERGLLMKNITSAPKTRLEKRQSIELRNKRFVAVAGSIIGLLVILSAAYLIMNDLNKQEPKTDVAVTKTMDQSKSKNVATNSKNTTKKVGSGRSQLSSSEYILADSDKKVLGEEDIAALSKRQLRLARNEIYARHGYVFNSADLQRYFSSKSWYQTDTSYNGALSEVEKENVKLLKEREAVM